MIISPFIKKNYLWSATTTLWNGINNDSTKSWPMFYYQPFINHSGNHSSSIHQPSIIHLVNHQPSWPMLNQASTPHGPWGPPAWPRSPPWPVPDLHCAPGHRSAPLGKRFTYELQGSFKQDFEVVHVVFLRLSWHVRFWCGTCYFLKFILTVLYVKTGIYVILIWLYSYVIWDNHNKWWYVNDPLIMLKDELIVVCFFGVTQ